MNTALADINNADMKTPCLMIELDTLELDI